MSPQLTLQTPLELVPSEVPTYLEQLWSPEQQGSTGTGASTFCLLIWQPAWAEQHLVRSGRLKGPITGQQTSDLIAAGRQAITEADLPLSTPPLDGAVIEAVARLQGDATAEDLRGQYIDPALSALMPRRLITLAPTVAPSKGLETLVAAYCPLPEEGGGTTACGDVVVLRGGDAALQDGMTILEPLLPASMPTWVWWNGFLDEAPELMARVACTSRRLIIDSAVGQPRQCLEVLRQRVESGQAVNDLNWLRLRSWRETLAMVFDPPDRRDALSHVTQLDIDVEGHHPAQGLLLAAWIADRLGWTLDSAKTIDEETTAQFHRPDGTAVNVHLMGVPVGQPNVHAGQIVGMRLICQPDNGKGVCVILCADSGGCMRLEGGGMANLDLHEDIVPVQHATPEMDVARLLGGGHDSTNPLLAAAAPLAAKLLG
ncbi:possible glucose 6-phosphate dehydrogenase effector OpcA [Synechococcus sp. CC9902]|jgi:glucose-6-phosphate dehydrogenase assembly protein OpcA|uniref:glucose-6-phosphate dehydrogenase assembly protein OpcA n=1 Tax=Synechococcus sp. (strain CC9902) TaxID=316279 RepID=UPI00005D3F79|nr:glucose-6-phosphate dehydrogenase assembly protein OpcA [Synechococcus sp. CC9902]ABB25715.1 possible glucose 6-phosphate dehydrogenase effector OpcA [Synechococcus sp. CC9902]MDG2192648.1 glucose-6-phosphate dehydrogenase assembly protein OpcA [Synechococcus sp. cluster2_bin.209]